MNLIDIVPLGETDIYLFALKNGVNPFSAKLFFGKKKKRKNFFFRKFYSYFSFYARERNLESSSAN